MAHLFIVYRIVKLCGGAHEISGIPASLCLCGWVVGGFMGWVGGGVDNVVGGVLGVGGGGGWVVRGWNPKIRNEGKELRFSEAVSSFTN